MSSESRQPIPAARLLLTDGSSLGTTDPNGAIALHRPPTPQRLRVAAIGFLFDELIVDPHATGPLLVALEPAVATLSELSTTSAAWPTRAAANTWAIDAEMASSVPVTVEPDLFRVLALTPSVSFSSIRSSRPLIRGIDADDTGFSIDGHEVVNLYHIGRSFAGFPQIAAEQVAVTSQPTRVDIGHTTSGRVEIRGLEWETDRGSELHYGLGAWSAMTGWSGGPVRAVLAGRTVAGSVAGAAVTPGLGELRVYDVYSRIDLEAGVPLSLTAFRSSDHGADTDPRRGEMATLDWGTTLVGLRAGLVQNASLTLELSGAVATRSERGSAVPTRNTIATVDNQHRRSGGRLDGAISLSDDGHALRIGAELGRLEIRNSIVPQDQDRFLTRALEHSGIESALHVEFETPIIGGVLRSGVRVDGLAQVTAVQPRLAFLRPIGTEFWTSVGVGRAARLVHLVSDAGADPKVGYYDLWLPADGATVPVSVADHLTAEVGWANGGHRVRVGVFSSRGSGVLDLGGSTFDARSVTTWRAGLSHVVGAEVELGANSRDGRWSGQLSYTLARSERDWGEGWVPWINDRQHQLRFAGTVRPLANTVLSPTIEFNSGLPYTPFLRAERAGRSYRSVFGTENSARGDAGIRFGAALQQELQGPFDTQVALGVSITNLGFGDQSVREASVQQVPVTAGGPELGARPSSRQLSELPVIPSVMLQVRF